MITGSPGDNIPQRGLAYDPNADVFYIGGWDDGKAGGVTYEYDPGTDKWTKKQSMPRPAHHAALAAANGKVYVMGGFVPPSDTALPLGAAWQPIDNAWEYDPAADSWKSLPPPNRRTFSGLTSKILLKNGSAPSMLLTATET